jgi:hypothetical protein
MMHCRKSDCECADLRSNLMKNWSIFPRVQRGMETARPFKRQHG